MSRALTGAHVGFSDEEPGAKALLAPDRRPTDRPTHQLGVAGGIGDGGGPHDAVRGGGGALSGPCLSRWLTKAILPEWGARAGEGGRTPSRRAFHSWYTLHLVTGN